MSSQGAIGSLAYTSGAVATAATTSYIFGRLRKDRKSIHISTRTNFKKNLSISVPIPFLSKPSEPSETKVSPKSPFERLKSLRSKCKRSKVSTTTTTTFVFSQKTMHSHTQVVHPDQPVEEKDNVPSIYPDVYAMNDRDRRTLSVPNLPTALQREQPWDTSPSASGVFIPRAVTETLLEEDEEDEDWDSQSDSTKTLSPSLAVSNTSRRRHSRCNSLPPPNIHDFSPSLFHRQPTPSESWDDDFDLDVNELNVPSIVEETQVSLRMDISNIKDFATHIRELKDLREEKENLYSNIQSKMTRKWTNGFLSMTYNKVKILETFHKRDWEEAAVIIDLADVADDKTTFGEDRVEVDIPSKRHMKVLKRIIVKGLGEDAKDFVFFDHDKENQHDYNIPSKNVAKKQKLMSFRTNDNNNEKRRRENLSMFVEVMPSLVDHLKELQNRLTRHVNELRTLIN